MFKNYIKIAWRNLIKDSQFTFLNVVGLSTGLACTLLIYLWVSDEWKMDRFNKKDGQLYQVMENRKQASGIWTAQTTSGLMADALANDMPEVQYAVNTASENDVILSVDNEKNIRADGLYAGKDFFKVFSYDLLQGDSNQVLVGRNSIALSDDMATRLFGSTVNVIGKSIEFQHEPHPYTVTGIFRKPDNHSSEQFDFLLTDDLLKDKEPGFQDWGSTFPHTYVILRPGVSVTAFNQKLANYLKKKTNNEILYRTPFITKFSEAYLYGRYEDGKQVGGRIEYVRLFSIIAGVILLIACINFMNLSTAKATGRAKEVGIKKVVGAGRFTLVLQYFGESLLMAFASLLVALLLVALVLPAFNGITGKQLTLNHPGFGLILWTLVILLVTGLLAGSYPALYLSGFKPAMVLKGKLKTATSEIFVRKGLVVFQFSLSVILIISVMVVYRQIHFIQTKKLGYDRDNVLAFYKEGKLSDPLQQESFLNAVRNIPGIVQASCIGHSLAGHSGGTNGVVWAGKDPNDMTEFEVMNVDYDFQDVLNIAMKEGRPYSREYVADTNKIIFNEAAVEFMGMTSPIGKKVTIWGKDLEIVGVMKDFNFQSLHEKIKPLFARLSPKDAYRFMLKIKPGKETAAIDQLEQVYKRYNPGFPLNASFLDESYQRLYAAENRVSVLSRCFAGLAILISCLGLFGLAAFNIQRRSREIGIRKVLGASVGRLVLLLSRDYLKLIGFSLLIAFPVAWWMTGNWLQSFVYHIQRGWGIFLLAGFVVILLTFLTISFQSIKAAVVNPSRSLKSE